MNKLESRPTFKSKIMTTKLDLAVIADEDEDSKSSFKSSKSSSESYSGSSFKSDKSENTKEHEHKAEG